MKLHISVIAARCFHSNEEIYKSIVDIFEVYHRMGKLYRKEMRGK